MMAATVSGSFHRHMTAISDAVRMLHETGVRVLSPADPRVVDEIGLFLFVASDRHRSVRLVQDRHLACIRSSHFLWLVCPDGYVGQSAAMELGFALAEGVPIYCQHWPQDLTLRQYVNKVESLAEAISTAATTYDVSTAKIGSSLLIDSSTAVEAAHQGLDRLQGLLSSPHCNLIGAQDGSQLAKLVEVERGLIVEAVDLPSGPLGRSGQRRWRR